ncbi:MAG: radical SAM protein [bacterium]
MLIWDITSRCNLSCIHCYNAEKYDGTRKDIGRELNIEEAKEAINKLQEAGFKQLLLIGGEPLIYSNIAQLVEFARNKGLEVAITTNGTLLGEEMALTLINLEIKSLIVSIDGISAETNDEIRGRGAFEKACKNLKKFTQLARARGSKVLTGIGFVVTKKNLSEIEYLPEFSNSLGISGIDLQFLTLDGRAACNWQEVGYTVEEALEATERIVLSHNNFPNLVVQVDCRPLFTDYIWKKHGVNLPMHPFAMRCKGSSYHYYMRADGQMHPCGPCDTKLAEKAKQEGLFSFQSLNIKDSSVSEILNSPYFLSFFKYANSPESYATNITCRDCEHNTLCRPCPLLSKSEGTGLIDECEWSKRKIRELDKEMLAKTPRIKKETRWIKQEDKIWVFDMKKWDFVTFEGIGNEIWDEFKKNLPLNGLIEGLYPMYSENVDKRTFKKDVLDFVYDIKNKGFIEMV